MSHKVVLLFYLLCVSQLFQINRAVDVLQHVLEETLKGYGEGPPPFLNLSQIGQSSNSMIYRRCTGHLACEYHVPVVEMRRVIFDNGAVIVPGPANQQLVDSLMTLHGAKKGHLPSFLVQTNANGGEFVAGPAFTYSQKNQNQNQKQNLSLEVCKNQWKNHSAFFVSPWVTYNAFHALNDNVFAMISSVVLQYLSTPIAMRSELYPRILYRFSKLVSRSSSTIYELLDVFFPQSLSAKKLLAGGPHCLQHGVWGAHLKVFYRDSLLMLRYTLYEVMKRLLAASWSSVLSPYPGIQGTGNNHKTLTTKRRPKVLIVTRNTYINPFRSEAAEDSALSISGNFRKLAPDSEARLVETFRALGADVAICCDFSKELQVTFSFGSDHFPKMAHMARGHYMLADLRKAPKDSLGYSEIDASYIEHLATLAIKMWQYGQSVHKQIDNYVHQTAFRSPSGPTSASLHSAPTLTKEDVLKRMYSDEIMINMAEKVVYRNPSASWNAVDVVEKGLGLTNFRVVDSSPPHLRTPRDSLKSEFLILPHPALRSAHTEQSFAEVFADSVWGPPIGDWGYAHCIQLPYFKFRYLTKAHTAVHLECDRPLIVAKRSGRSDSFLLTTLLP
eukprot:scaffold1931_cov215-Ochromonas_danica.AAC.27